MTTNAYAPVLDAIARLRAGDVARGSRPPVLVALSGAVGVGKSTLAALLARHLEERGLTAEVVCTDGFLLPNADLESRDLLMRKGFPETFDDRLLVDVLSRLRGGELPLFVPEYSHLSYDRVDGPGRLLGTVDVVIVEGVNALQRPVIDHVDLAVYLDADDDALLAWFTARFLALCAEADADPGGGSFYCAFLDDPPERRRAIAEEVWRKVNAVNLTQHIGPSRAAAHWVVRKDADHAVREVVGSGAPS